MRRTVIAAAAVLLSVACSAESPAATQVTKVGFVFVGERDDLGYNQAAWEGSESLARAFPDLDILRIENVPETGAVTQALEGLIDDGATILFATSFGYLDDAYEVARDHPEVTVLHQGGVEPEPRLDNFGTYFGTHSEAMYLAGVVAGAATQSNRLGFVGAFPIPATYTNVNAFTLGAQSVNAEITTLVRFTAGWCDPEQQAAAAADLLAAGVDVLGQHQDCTRTILEAAETAGVASVGYHSDGSEVAPRGWLIGPVWVWDDLFIDIVQQVLQSNFAASAYNGDFRATFADADTPFVLTEPGPTVGADARDRLAAERRRIEAGGSPFSGPLVDRDGALRVPDKTALSVAELDSMDWFVRGVEGEVPDEA